MEEFLGELGERASRLLGQAHRGGALVQDDQQPGEVARADFGDVPGRRRTGLDQLDQPVDQPRLVLGEAAGDVGVTGGVERELHGEQEPALVLLPSAGEFAQQPGGQVRAGAAAEEGGPKVGEQPVDLLVVEGEEQLFLVLVVGVEGAPGESGAGDDVTDRGGVEAVLGEQGQGTVVQCGDGQRAALRG